ncbi:hypothetical protein SAMN05216326_13910 [Nitrosomonas marina]|uniref:Lipoprotein n=1 Tax=Nitrosomonas marina TaxID=917 RepID=A0A1I0FIJ9_9PROT|nr:hypothetical protein [Nitrosomonas marina]SET58082.1 hypothetical protein SAMN05216326_13910 [Nitrosomonas marina]
MKPFSIFPITIVTILFLLLTGCEPTDGKLELKEPKKELSEMPERKGWFDTPISQQPADESTE